MQSEKKLANYEVLLCLTGGIACYKIADLASKLTQAGAKVTVAMTENAMRFVGPVTFTALTGRPVFTTLWQGGEDFRTRHISLTERADLMVIAPATANIIAKIAHGLADDLVSTMALAAAGSCDILIAPAMNSRMLSAPATQENLAKISDWAGFETIGPASGNLACGTAGPGRMVESAELLEQITKMLTDKPAKKSASETRI